MAPLLTIDADASRLIAILDQLGPAALKHTKPAAKVTADNVKREAIARHKRQLLGPSTGQTAAGITVQEDYNREGYVVLSSRQQMYNLPLWLEFGTKYMRPRPYFFSSARLEEGAYDRRMRDAIQAAADEVNP